MKIKEIPGIGFDSNVYLLMDGEKAALIDTGTGFNFHHVMEEIEREIPVEKIDKIVLTHEHFDHCGGVTGLKNLCNAEVMIHEKGAEIVERGIDSSASFFGVEQPPIKIDRKLNDGDRITVGEQILEVIYTPGHSPGSICLYEPESKSLFSGDTIFSDGGIGRTDFPGGSMEELVESIRRIDMDVLDLYPGHGPRIIKNGAKHVKMALKTAEYMTDI